MTDIHDMYVTYCAVKSRKFERLILKYQNFRIIVKWT